VAAERDRADPIRGEDHGVRSRRGAATGTGSPARRFAVVLAVLCAAGGTAAADLMRSPDRAAAAAFHAVTGGLGTGPGLDFAGCGPSFDARAEDVCEDLLEPLPGCAPVCPSCGYHDRPIR
jgi:hypothetical protein